MEAALTATGDGAVAEIADEKPLRPKQCHDHLQRTLAKEFRAIVQGFVKEAKNGGCAHMKLAADLLEPSRPPARKKKDTAQRLLEELGE